MRERFIREVKCRQSEFGLEISDSKIELLADHFEIVQENNEILHLVAPGSVEEFAVRHVLESLTLLEYLPRNARFADIGPGAGFPSIPCLLVRDDLQSVLIESKLKKSDFLKQVLERCVLHDRATVINRQFEEVERPEISFVTCRALDKFTKKIPKMLKWSADAKFLFFGGENLREALSGSNVKFEEKLIPLSERRFLFVAK